MSGRLDDLRGWMAAPEDEHLEFKEAKNSFEFKDLVKYCCALANEGGGRIVLGVTDRRPRRVVGSRAFDPIERTKAGLVERLRMRVTGEVISHPDGRVAVFEVPPRPLGVPVQYKGAYWMRGGDGLVGMTPDQLKRILDETGPDFSAEICPSATLDDLDPEAIQSFAALWARKSGSVALAALPRQQILADAELVLGARVTYAALVLFAITRALGRHLAQAEVVFEYRSSEASIASQDRAEYRLGFFLFFDALWAKVNLRNEVQQAPRNRRIAEALARCGLVERAGQGMNRMFGECIKESKPRPDFSRSDAYEVAVRLAGDIQDERFLRFLEKVGRERLASFGLPDLLVLDAIYRDQPVEGTLRERLGFLAEQGVVEKLGRGRGVRHILSRRFYGFLGKKGAYTRRRGLDRETNKALLARHIADNAEEGSQMRELMQVLPALSRTQVQVLLRELRKEGHVRVVGRTKAGRWFPAEAGVLVPKEAQSQ